jgi:hypothetical protein
MSVSCHSATSLRSSEDIIGSDKHRLRDRDIQRIRCFVVDEELEFGGLVGRHEMAMRRPFWATWRELRRWLGSVSRALALFSRF